MAAMHVESLLLTRVLPLFVLIFGFSSNNVLQVFARRSQELGPRYAWPNATIPYVIDCSIANVFGAKGIIKAAMQEWENRTCVRFVKRTNQRSYLLIRRQKGCWGQVGYRRGSVVLSMGDGCEYKYVMMHELGHVIGFYHEHQRDDRDEFIDILWDNVVNSMLKQFFKRPKPDHMDTELPYDTSSIMHYQFTAFAKNNSLDTIAVKDRNSTEKPKPYSYITDLDVRKAHEMYNCPYDEPKNESEEKTVVKKKEDEKKEKIEEKENVPVEIVEAVEVSLMSSGWLANKGHDRVASIMVNGRELAKNKYGLNVVVFNYLSGKHSQSTIYSVTTKHAGKIFSDFIKVTPRRNYILIAGKVRSLFHLNEARKALHDIGIKLPRNIASGSSICIVGYKGKEEVDVKYVIAPPKEKAAFLTMNITLASDYSCQNDAVGCYAMLQARKGSCQKQPRFYLKSCQKACGSCRKGKPCEDENEECDGWAKKRYCYSHPAYMLKYCKVSCKICRKALPARVRKVKAAAKRKIVVVDDVKARVKKYLTENDGDDDGRQAVGTKCADKSKTCPAWAKVGRCKTDTWVIQNCLISCRIKGACDRRQIRPEGVCSEPFGLGWDRTLPDEAFTASSFYQTGEWNASADNARLYMEDDFKTYRIGAWCAEYPARQGEWLKIDLGEVRRITAVATQGRFRYYEHVKTYKLSYSREGKRWRYYQEDGRTKELKGNCDHVSPVLNILDKSVSARYLRFHPIKYYEGICMRVEVYGCTV